MASIEKIIEDKAKRQLDKLKIPYFTPNESINTQIDKALSTAPSKKGGEGKNYPDIRLFLSTSKLRKIPVMIEVKGIKGRLAKFKDSKGEIDNFTKEGKISKNVSDYALNGAIHYANAILDYTDYNEVIAVGINGYHKDETSKEVITEYAFYYLSRTNLSFAKKIGDFKDLSCFANEYLDKFVEKIDTLSLSNKEREKIIDELESDIESKLNSLNQFLHDELLDVNPNMRVSLLVGMIMANLGVKDKVAPLELKDLNGVDSEYSNDGQIFITKIKDFLKQRGLPDEKRNVLINDLKMAFIDSKLWKIDTYKYKNNTDESPLKKTYTLVLDNIIPLVKKLQTADIAGRLFNSITKWLKVPDNEKNDVVLTPRYVVDLMVALAKVNRDSYVWDYATGSGAFLISAMNAMIKDCESIQSPKAKDAKIAHIKAYQLLGIEKRLDIYLLGILNMILLDDGAANLLHENSLVFNGNYEQGDKKGEVFPANVFLLNPPYSADGKGFVFVEKALKRMLSGKAVIIIQENAGSGNGLPYTQEILSHSTLLASIKMPPDLFIGKSSVQTAIYVFDIGTPHDKKHLVKFINFSNDGYKRMAKKKAKASANLRDIDNVKGRYEELINIVLYGSKYLGYYKNDYIEDTISLNGKDWTFSQHQKIDTTPRLEDFKKCVSEYLAWEVSNILKSQGDLNRPF